MKKKFEVTKYYVNNKRISKFHGILFMLFGLIVLATIVYGLFDFYNNSLNNAFQSYNYGIDCSEYSYLQTQTNESLKDFEVDKEDYLRVKQNYYNTYGISSKLTAMDTWKDKYNEELIKPYNAFISLYNSNLDFYENCYKEISFSSKIDSINTYIEAESEEIDKEFEGNLRPMAESEGYIFSPQ
jgi:hypothetical protein